MRGSETNGLGETSETRILQGVAQVTSLRHSIGGGRLPHEDED